jgi:coenzyme F420-0:L-glutamate ligase/coenzyme F420-1:gamma-L-glutamate ligase
LLPIDSDKSANKLLSDISDLSGESDFAVIITDTFGRAWREGHVNFAIGSAGIALFIDYKDSIDTVGKQLKVTNIAVADEIAAASELVTGKLDNIPAVIVRGYNYDKSPSQRIDYLLRSPDNDLFR